MLVKRYRVLDPHARKIGGVWLNDDGTVSLTDAQARYPLDQRQIEAMPVLSEPPPEPPASQDAGKRARRRR